MFCILMTTEEIAKTTTNCCSAVTNGNSSLSSVLSVIAIVVAIGTAIFEFFWNRVIFKMEISKDIAKEIYNDFLLVKIPEAREKISYNKKRKKIEGTESLEEILNEVRKASLYYKFSDKKFFTSLKKDLQNLEDYLVLESGNKMDEDDYLKVATIINASLENIYKSIISRYIKK